MRYLMLVLVLAGASALTACGGSFGGDVEAVSQLAITSSPGYDGYIRSDGYVNAVNIVSGFGDNVGNLYYRSFFGFSLASLPAGAQITGARLRLTRVADSGIDLGDRLVEHVDLGAVLDLPDFSAAAISLHGGVLQPSGNPDEFEIDVTLAVAQDVFDGSSRSDFRVRFAANVVVNGASDLESYATAENVEVAWRPELIVTYLEP